jgi:hypothetical protein
MSSAIKAVKEQFNIFIEDVNTLRTKKDMPAAEYYKLMLSVFGRAVGFLASAIVLYLYTMPLTVFLAGHDLFVMGRNFREVRKSEGATVSDQVLAFIRKNIPTAKVENVKYNPILHGTWIFQHVYQFVKEYEHESVKQAKEGKGAGAPVPPAEPVANAAEAALSTVEPAKAN